MLRLILLGALLGLSAAAPPAAAQAPSAAPPAWSFACPAAGTRVTYQDGRRIAWAGADPADPVTCLGREERPGRAPRALRRLHGLIDLPDPDEAALRAGLAGLFPAVPGLRFGFSPGGGTNGGTNGAPSGALGAREEWRVEGYRQARLGGAELRVLRLSRSRSWPGTPRFLALVYALDTGSGALVQMAGSAGGDAGAAGLLVPLGAVGLELPLGASGLEVPRGAAGLEVPRGAAGLEVPRGAAGLEVPRGAAGLEVPRGAAGPEPPGPLPR